MKKMLTICLCSAVLFSGCTTTESGMHNGAMFGSIIGSAIGGLSGGPRGSDIGTLAGMAGGAIVGAAIGHANEEAEMEKYREYKAQRRESMSQQRYDDSYGYNDGYAYGNHSRSDYAEGSRSDDIIEFGPDDGMNSGLAGRQVTSVGEHSSRITKGATMRRADASSLQIRNARFEDSNGDGVLSRGEEARMVFEIVNTSPVTVCNVQPIVTELTGNRHIFISQNVLIESIAAGKGIRYTATVKAGSHLRNGEAVIGIGVREGSRELKSQSKEFPVATSRY